MRDDIVSSAYKFVVITLDSHAAGPAARVAQDLASDFPGLEVSIHAAATWSESPKDLEKARLAVREADIIVSNLLFIEEHINYILPDLIARRDACDAIVGVIADNQIVNLTKMGNLDMSKPTSAAMKLLKKLKPKTGKASSGESSMKMLRRLPQILKFLPGKAQDLRAYFLTMQYWLGGSDDNVREMIRFLIGRYSKNEEWRQVQAAEPIDYAEVGVYHPDLPNHKISTNLADLPRPNGATATIGIVMLRSYILAGDTAHYDAVIRSLEARGLAVIPAFSGGLDARPAIDRYMHDDHGATIDCMISLTGFSLVGGPAYNDSDAAIKILSGMDVPYVAAHSLEFQTLGQWANSESGLGPVETTMLIALPEIDGATNPTVFGGRHGEGGCQGCSHMCDNFSTVKEMAPCHERITSLAEKVSRLAILRRKANKDKKVGIVLFGFPPNAGAAGTAAYLSVFESLHNTLKRMSLDGYKVDVPETVEDLRKVVLE